MFLAWLTCVALQLALLGVTGTAAARAGIADSGTRTQPASPAVSVAQRLLAPEPNDRRAPVTPFAPAAIVRLEIPAIADIELAHRDPRLEPAGDATALPLARAPPTLS